MAPGRGFTLVELVVTMALVLVVGAGVVAVVRIAPDTFLVQTEASDMHQRLRVAAGALSSELMAAQAIRPYRSHGAGADPPGSFKTDVVTAVGDTASTTFWLKADAAAEVYQLMSYAGGVSPDVPVVDNVVGLAFEYFGDPKPPTLLLPLTDLVGPWTTYGPKPSLEIVPSYAAGENCVFALDESGASVPRLPALAPPDVSLVPLAAAQLTDGPWCPDAAASDRWDADLLRVRAVLVTLRVQAAAAALRGPAGVLFARAGTSQAAGRRVPDLEIRVRVAPRNLNRGR
jgi:prepilin-type N-terminal cleavage/methylation domain-containing protein